MSNKINLAKHLELQSAQKETKTVPVLLFGLDNVLLPDTDTLIVNRNQLNADARDTIQLAIDQYNNWIVLAFSKINNDSATATHIEKISILAKVEFVDSKYNFIPKFKYETTALDQKLVHGNVIDDLPTVEEKEELKVLSNQCILLLKTIIGLDDAEDGSTVYEIEKSINENSDPSMIFAMCVTFTEFTTQQTLHLLNEKNLQKKFKFLINILQSGLSLIENKSKEKERQDSYKKIKERIETEHSQAMLKEMRSEIDKKLENDNENIADQYEKKLEQLQTHEESKNIIRKEIKRLKSMNSASAEYHVIDNYLSTVFSIPWSTSSDSNFDLKQVKEVLNADHTGIQNVKKRVSQFLAVSKISEKSNGQILCLFGPPGVGKTSICKSIAKSLNREYVRISLGGVSDEAEMRGHRKTYVGAMPGKIINALISCKTNNPIIVLDEIDKLSKQGHKGNVEAALLEILDPEQNKSFVDHYVNLKVDLSSVFFIATANDISQISAPLRDRMDMIEMDSYTVQEKIDIGQRHLIPQELEKSGLKSKNVTLNIEESALQKLITQYTREAGVRQLRQKIATIARSCAEKFLDGQNNFNISIKNLTEFIDDDFMEIEQIKTQLHPGMATGLAWTPVGGDVLFVEASAMPGTGNIKLTGQLGDVMKESAQLALSYIREHADKLDLASFDHKTKDIHIHFPAGATPKDGPSAGVALVTTLVSLLKNEAVSPKIAMTGEISLKGDVLPVGGIKEKLIAAHTHKISEVMIPRENEKDLKKLPKEILEDSKFKIHLIDTIDDALKIVFKSQNKPDSRPKKIKNDNSAASI